MKVRILSGSQKGAVVEMGRPEAEGAIDTGYAELYVEPAPAVEPEAGPEEPRRRGKRE